MQNEANPAPFSTSPGQVLSYGEREYKFFEIKRLRGIVGIRTSQSGFVFDFAGTRKRSQLTGLWPETRNPKF
jgi:hypothetical protein